MDNQKQFKQECYPNVQKEGDKIICNDKLKNKNNEEVTILLQSDKNAVYLKQSQPQQQDIVITQDDLIGAKIKEQKNAKNQYEIQIFALNKGQGGCCGGNKEKRKLNEQNYFHEDLEKLQIWRNILLHYVRNKDYLSQNWEQLQNKQPLNMFNDKLLIFVNPASGPGKSPQMWDESKELINIAGYETNVIKTERRNHAADVVREMQSDELFSYFGILSLSGDGLPNEITNALACRSDSEKALKIGICSLPGGSGNALAKNVAERSQEAIGITGAIFNVLKGQKLDIDMMELTLDSQQEKVYSIVSINYAFVADLDINSEFLRCLGGLRFDVYGAYRAFCQKKYPAKLYTRLQDKNNNQEEETKNEDINLVKNSNWELTEGEFKYLVLSNLEYISETCQNAPLCQMDDGFFDVQGICNGSWFSLLSHALAFSAGDHFDKKNKKPKRKDLNFQFVKEFILETESKDSLFSIDGEEYHTKKIEGKVRAGALRIFCNDKRQQQQLQK